MPFFKSNAPEGKNCIFLQIALLFTVEMACMTNRGWAKRPIRQSVRSFQSMIPKNLIDSEGISFCCSTKGFHLIDAISSARFQIRPIDSMVLGIFHRLELPGNFHLRLYPSEAPFTQIVRGGNGKISYPQEVILPILLYSVQ